MAHTLNSMCDFQQGFFMHDLPVDVIELVLRVRTRCSNHTLREDREKRTQKFRTWERQTDDDNLKSKIDSLSHTMTTDSEEWIPTFDYIYRPKLFNDPRGTSSDRENMPELELIPMSEGEILEWTEEPMKRDNKQEAQVAKQILLPETSSPNTDMDLTGSMEQLETFTEDDKDVSDFSERPDNDKRPARPPRKLKTILQNLIPPLGCPNYMAMNAAVAGIPKPHSAEIRGMTPEKRKVPREHPACLKRSPPKVTLQNNDIYCTHTDDSIHHYEELQEKNKGEEHVPKEKNMRIFCKLIRKENISVINAP